MKIALAHYRVNETDGVSMEIGRWYDCLKKMGHECCFISGSEKVKHNVRIPFIDFKNEENIRINRNCYEQLKDWDSPEKLRREIFRLAKGIENALVNAVRTLGIECVIVANILSLGWNLPAAIGFYHAIEKLPDVKFVCVDSEIYWEREMYEHPVVDFVKPIHDAYLLPDRRNVKHCVISASAKNEMLKRRGIYAEMLVRTFQFGGDGADAYASDFRDAIGVRDNDILILNPSRIVSRKAIEFSVRLVAEMQARIETYRGKPMYNGKSFSEDSKIYLILYNINETFEQEYYNKIRQYARELDVRLMYIRDLVYTKRGTKDGRKVYLSTDVRDACDAVVISSILESWGDQILQVAAGKKSLALFEYPVFGTDIRRLGLSVCSLGSKYYDVRPLRMLDDEAVRGCADEMLALLFDAEKYALCTEHNYKKCKTAHSTKVLKKAFTDILRFH